MIPLQCDEYNLPRCCTRPASFCFRFKCKQKLLNPKIIFVAKRIAIHEMLLKIVFRFFFAPQYFLSIIFFSLILSNLFRIFPFAQLFHNSTRSWISKIGDLQVRWQPIRIFSLHAALAKSSNTRRKNSAASDFLLKIFFGLLILNFLTFDFIRYTEKSSHSRFAKVKVIAVICLIGKEFKHF